MSTTIRITISILLLASAALRPAPAAALADEACVKCHEVLGDVALRFNDGSSRPAAVKLAALEGSVHGRMFGCRGCHADVEGYPHRERVTASARQYRADQARACETCHRVEAADYARSVHARSESGRARGDVPVCTDCHGFHAVSPTGTAQSHAVSAAVCIRCHGDGERMAPYGLSARVATTYLDDFHGASNQIVAAGRREPTQLYAACIDCHGTHDVQDFASGLGHAEVQAQVALRCRACLADLDNELAGWWLSHRPPRPWSAPIPWTVEVFYALLIPLFTVALVIYLGMDLARARRGAVATRETP